MEGSNVYSLCPLSPLHLGGRGIGMEEAVATVPSDTLFSALCWALRESAGRGWLEELLSCFLGGSPPFLITSALPRIGGVRLYPRPSSRAPLGPEPGDSVWGERAKQFRKSGFVSDGLFRQWLAAASLAAELDEEENLLPGGIWISRAERERLPAEASVPWAGPAPTPRVALDRTSSRSSLYHVGEVRYREGCGLWFAVRWLEPAWREPLEVALHCLGEAGIGGERSAGRGQFRWEREEGPPLPEPAPGRPAVTLSLYHPTRAEVEAGELDGACYRPAVRRGWIASPDGPTCRGRAVRMLAEGSVVGPGVRGDLVDVTPEGFSAHRVYRYGLAFLVPMEVDADG